MDNSTSIAENKIIKSEVDDILVFKTCKLEDEMSGTSTPTSVREKRIRKQKTYDNDYVVSNSRQRCQMEYENEVTVTTTIVSDVETVASSAVTTTNDIKFNIGDLVWAKVSGHPWWPCMISIDSSENNHVKMVGVARPKRMFHVDFFGPSVEHAWVIESGLIEYKGIEAFKTYAQDQVDQAPTKSQKEKLAERFQLKVALTRRDQWERAVEEADTAMEKRTINERKSMFQQKVTSCASRNRRNTASNDESKNVISEENSKIVAKKLSKLKRESTSSVNTNEDSGVKVSSTTILKSNRLQKRKVNSLA